MATIVTNVSKTVVFQDSNGNQIVVDKFEDGLVHVVIFIDIVVKHDEVKGVQIRKAKELVEFISGCFAEESNLRTELLKAFNVGKNTQFIGFKFTGGNDLIIKKENSDTWSIEEIFQKWINQNNKDLIEKSEELKDEKMEKDKKYDEIIDSLYTVGFECKEESMEQEVGEQIQLYEGENHPVWLAFILASYIVYLIQKEEIEFSKVADKAYEEIEKYVFGVITNEDLQEAINWLEKYWKNGDEIKEWYINRTVQEFNGFADML